MVMTVLDGGLRVVVDSTAKIGANGACVVDGVIGFCAAVVAGFSCLSLLHGRVVSLLNGFILNLVLRMVPSLLLPLALVLCVFVSPWMLVPPANM